MTKTSKIMRYLGDNDIRDFIKYTVTHPLTIRELKRQEVSAEDTYFQANIRILKTYDPDDIDIKAIPVPEYSKEGIDVFKREKHIVHLAGVNIEENLFAVNWSRTLEDFEDETALHRFIWLQRIVAENISNVCVDKFHDPIRHIILSWIEDTANSKDVNRYTVWQTYTVVERIICWCVVLGLTKRGEEDKRIIASLLEQAEYIKNNLEFHGSMFTGGHFTNDGRGLYIVGALLEISEYQDLGRKIFLEECKHSFCGEFFFEEGSSHYHFLFTKWLCDLFWISGICGDSIFRSEIRIYLEKALEGCRFFLTKDKNRGWWIPFYGDISPDYTPEWLIGIPWVANYLLTGNTYGDVPLTAGYHDLFLNNGVPVEGSVLPEAEQYQSKDWGVVQNSQIKVFSHAGNILYPNNARGHVHQDSGSVVISYRGFPFIIDSGRRDYLIQQTPERQKSWEGHNALTIDRKNPGIAMKKFFTDSFLEKQIGDAPMIDLYGTVMEIHMDCGGRLGHAVKSREVCIEGNSVVLIDEINGDGEHEVDLNFVFSDGVKIKKKKGCILAATEDFVSKINYSVESDTLKCGLASIAEEYGGNKIVKTAAFHKKAKLPFILKTMITFYDKKV